MKLSEFSVQKHFEKKKEKEKKFDFC